MVRVRSFPFIIVLILTTGLFPVLNGQEQQKQVANPEASRQNQAPYVFKATTRLVVVDVVATDGKGNPVTDLQAGDFTVSESGKAQRVSSFSLHQMDAAGSQTSDQPASVAALPPNVYTNSPRYKAGVWNVIVLDYMNSQVTSQAALRQQLLEVLEKIPDAPVAVYLLTNKLYLLHDFGGDQAQLKQTIAELKNHAQANLDNPKGGHEAERYSPAFIGTLRPRQLESLLHWEAQSTEAGMSIRLRMTVDALSAIVRNMAALPGRKNLLWVSQGFPFSIDPGNRIRATDAATGRDFEVAIPSGANGLLDSQVAIYPIDPRGVVGPDTFDPGNRGFDAIGRPEQTVGINATASLLNGAENASHASMNELAERTGGRALYRTNNVGDAVVRSMEDGGTYYTLSYYPEDKNWDGRFRHISIKTHRAGVKLRYRSGYFAIHPLNSSPAMRAEQDAAFRQAFELDVPTATSLIFQAGVVAPSRQTQNRLLVNFQAQPGAVTFEKGADELQHVNVECAVKAFTEEGAPVKAEGTTLAGAVKPEIYDKIVREGFPCSQALELSPGSYRLRMGIRDIVSGRFGTTEAQVVISKPEMAAPALPASR